MKISVTAQYIPHLLDQAPAGVKVLSLDCFDTLLWLNAQAPSDIFAELGIEAKDGTLLRRSAVAQFAGLARRPRAGNRSPNQQVQPETDVVSWAIAGNSDDALPHGRASSLPAPRAGNKVTAIRGTLSHGEDDNHD